MGIEKFFLIILKFSRDPLKCLGSVTIEIPIAPPPIIEDTISITFNSFLIVNPEGDENFISEIIGFFSHSIIFFFKLKIYFLKGILRNLFPRLMFLGQSLLRYQTLPDFSLQVIYMDGTLAKVRPQST